ncbi:MAG: hypothetical protein M1823_001488 [Watsoniomyces obsoletus]|nr:MAG: hypothetical protein M1823_001488 [Watsoniomyces obsoletus]
MHAKTLLISSLASLAMASPEALDKRQQPTGVADPLASLASLANVQTTDPAVVSSLLGALSTLAGAFESVPESVISVLATGLPESLRDDPLAAAATGTGTPAWFSSLPSDVQTILAAQASSIGSLVTSLGLTNTGPAPTAGTGTTRPSGQSTTTRVGPLATGVVGNGTVGGGRNVTVSSGSLTTTIPVTTGTASTTGGTAGAGGQSTTRTSNPGVKPTGAMAASLVGLVGVLGAAIVL